MRRICYLTGRMISSDLLEKKKEQCEITARKLNEKIKALEEEEEQTDRQEIFRKKKINAITDEDIEKLAARIYSKLTDVFDSRSIEEIVIDELEHYRVKIGIKKQSLLEQNEKEREQENGGTCEKDINWTENEIFEGFWKAQKES